MANSEQASFKFTRKAIEALPAPDPSGNQRLFWDRELTGFGVLVSGVTGAKSYVVQRKLPGGRTRRVTIAATNVLELDKARENAKSVLAQFYEGVDPKAARRAGGKMTLQTALDLYIEARADLRETSKKGYRNSIERHLESWLKLPLRDITPDMVEARHREIKRDTDIGAKKNDGRAIKVTGAATANAVMRALRTIWNFGAERVPDLPANPVRRLRRSWYPVERRERLVRADELPAFYKAVDALPSRTARDYLMLLLFSGLRRNEAAQLKWTDLDFAGRVVRIPAGVTKAGRKLDLPMTDLVHGLLVARQNLGRDGDYVFPASGKRGYLQEPKFPLAAVQKATGIKISPHDLRRTFVTVAESTDISPLALKGLVNHALGRDVTSGYVQMTVERLREPAQRVADKIRNLCQIGVPENIKRLGSKS